ncbi:hypothetical protein Q5692_39345, partial [Microcoleus sp. C2C3]|uniref:hypothetical protein n=1 Tax=unclassified Microcoleus TaxID=2642155 RepID=UPI002FD113F7
RFHPILPFFVYPLDNLHFFLTCHKWLDLGFLFLPPSGSFIQVNRFDESPAGQYTKLALRAHEEGYEMLKKEDIDQVLAGIADEWARVGK